MARDPLARVTGNVHTPQNQPIPGREAEQVRNNAGGYTFAKDVWTRLEDFLILGTEGGTYYLGEDKLTEQNVGVVREAITADGVRAVKLATEISSAVPSRTPKNKPALFLLASAAVFGDGETKQQVKNDLAKVARTTDHLSSFFGYWKSLGGKRTGRAMRTAFGSWFLEGETERVAWKALKARQRKTPQGEALALRDVLRLAHPVTDDPARKALLGWLAGNVSDAEARSHVNAIDAYLEAQAVKTPRAAINVITARKVPWEYLRDAMLKSPEVWEALAGTIGMTALLRNLARMTTIGALKPLGGANDVVIERLTNADALKYGRIHPMDVFLAMRVYASGFAQPNPKAPARTWEPVSDILDALEESYDLSFGHVEPSGKKLLIAVDSSGSMTWGGVKMGGSPLGMPYEIANAMAVILKRIEGRNAHIINASTSAHPSRITARTNLREIASWRASGGGTDMSVPFVYAEREGLNVDGIVVFTDNETWAGGWNHPTQALESYRRRINPAARAVVASMTAAGHSIADPKDDGVLNIVGMDAALPKVALEFIR